MNKDQKAAVIDEIAANISDSAAIFAVDYRGISVEQARELRGRLREADATLRVVKNSLAERAADKAGAELIKTLLQGPTALTFVRGDGAVAAKSLADFARSTQLLAFKGGVMDGAALSAAEMTAIARLPTRDALYGQLVGLIASPVAGLARALNALIGGLAIGLGGVLEQKAASAGPSPAEQSAPAEPAPAEERAEAPAVPAEDPETVGPADEGSEERPAGEGSDVGPVGEGSDEGPASEGSEDGPAGQAIDEESAPEASGDDDEKENA
jgi:large subunit ribosomal protein L10